MLNNVVSFTNAADVAGKPTLVNISPGEHNESFLVKPDKVVGVKTSSNGRNFIYLEGVSEPVSYTTSFDSAENILGKHFNIVG